MKRTITAVTLAALGAMGLASSRASGAAIEQAEAITIYETWLDFHAQRSAELAIAMTSENFVMVSQETPMDRDTALGYLQALSQFVVTRQCTNRVVHTHPTDDKKGRLLLARVDCSLQTLTGPLEAHFLETVVIDGRGDITYDHVAEVANPSLP